VFYARKRVIYMERKEGNKEKNVGLRE
jgi:hypothetical protein